MDSIGRVLVSLLGTHAATSLLARASEAKDRSGKGVKDRLHEMFPELKKEKIVVKEGPASITFKGEKNTLLSSLAAKDPGYELMGAKDESSGAIAHEVGHILNDKAWGRPGRAAHMLSRYVAGTLQPATVFSAAVADTPTHIPGAIQAAISVPMLVDEALASSRAVHHLISTKGFKEGLKESLPLIPAFGSYAAHSAAPAVVTVIRKL